MEKKTKLDGLRKLIREEVTNAIRKELPILLAEQFERHRMLTEGSQKSKIKENLSSKLKSTVSPAFVPPMTLNTSVPKPAVPNLSLGKSNPLQSMLNETAMSMTQEDGISLTTDDFGANPINLFQPAEAQVGDISDVLATARPSSDISMVQINTVPDYTDLMNRMLSKGAI